MTIRVVAGTDTEVGKTIVTAALAAAAVRHERTVAVVKPAQTGVPDTDTEAGDLAVVRRLVPAVRTYEGIRLPDPLAPDRAALVSGRSLPTLAQQRDLVLGASADVVLVEGAGGVTVNLGRDFGLLELAASLVEAGRRVDWVVVARAGLGTLNHTKLTVNAIVTAGFRVEGIVIGSWPQTPGQAALHNRDDLPRYCGVPLLGAVPEGSGSLGPNAFGRHAPGWIPYASS